MASMLSKLISIPCYACMKPGKISQFVGSYSPYPIIFPPKNDNKKSSISFVYASISRPLRHSDNQTSEYLHIANELTIERERNMLRTIGENPFESLEMIDAIQRLGIDHHFQHEIEEILQKLYSECGLYQCYSRDLCEVALCFRLLRQEGYHVPESIFNNFKDKNGKFNADLRKDIRGLMELFEASQLSIEGEEILDEAREFAVNNLKQLSSSRENHEASAILNVLDRPTRKSFSRITANKFISTSVTGEKEWLRSLQQVAKIDFNVIQSLHQDEISQTFSWWRELGLAQELTKARDQPLKWHMWSMAILEDPSLSEQRLDLTKAISFIYIIDDIFDVYGGLDELTIFTEVIERWDYDGLEELPNYMGVCFKCLDTITTEISLKVYKSHGWDPIDSIRKSWATLCKAFLVEAKWFASGYLPDTEEYLKNGIVSSGVHVVMLHVFFLLGHQITKENVEFIDSNPRILSSTATILRLWDDLGSAKDENQDGLDGSYLECYMKQHRGSTIDEAKKQVVRMISNAWKCLNEECLFPRPFSGPFTKACLNLARMVPLMYTYDDNHRLPGLEEYLKSLIGN